VGDAISVRRGIRSLVAMPASHVGPSHGYRLLEVARSRYGRREMVRGGGLRVACMLAEEVARRASSSSSGRGRAGGLDRAAALCDRLGHPSLPSRLAPTPPARASLPSSRPLWQSHSTRVSSQEPPLLHQVRPDRSCSRPVTSSRRPTPSDVHARPCSALGSPCPTTPDDRPTARPTRFIQRPALSPLLLASSAPTRRDGLPA
jgi:hypothetical protein